MVAALFAAAPNREFLAALAAGRPELAVMAQQVTGASAHGVEFNPEMVELSRRLAQTIPGARLHVVEGGPHFPNRSHRAEVHGVIADFLGSLGI